MKELKELKELKVVAVAVIILIVIAIVYLAIRSNDDYTAYVVSPQFDKSTVQLFDFSEADTIQHTPLRKEISTNEPINIPSLSNRVNWKSGDIVCVDGMGCWDGYTGRQILPDPPNMNDKNGTPIVMTIIPAKKHELPEFDYTGIAKRNESIFPGPGGINLIGVIGGAPFDLPIECVPRNDNSDNKNPIDRCLDEVDEVVVPEPSLFWLLLSGLLLLCIIKLLRIHNETAN